MPNVKYHDKVTNISSILIIAVCLFSNITIINTVIIFLSYLFSGFMFNGDLDIFSKPYQRWGIFKFIWIPYRNLFKHRSIYTHGFIFGTLIRLIWLLIIPSIVVIVLNINLMFLLLYDYQIISLLVGLELGSMSHSIMDWIH